MHNHYVDILVQLAGIKNPIEQPTNRDWGDVERDFGYKFPIDFKNLVSRLGSGSFGCGLALQNPCASYKHKKLSRESLVIHRSMIADLEKSISIKIFPSAGGMVLIASLDRQDFYLAPDSPLSKSLSKLVWLNIDTGELKLIGLTFSQFIHDLYKRLINEPWADELRNYFWGNERWPLFTPIKNK